MKRRTFFRDLLRSLVVLPVAGRVIRAIAPKPAPEPEYDMYVIEGAQCHGPEVTLVDDGGENWDSGDNYEYVHWPNG